MGANRQQVAGPEEENWPRDSSMKKMGIPTSSSIMTYGMKKAPAKSSCNHDYHVKFCTK